MHYILSSDDDENRSKWMPMYACRWGFPTIMKSVDRPTDPRRPMPRNAWPILFSVHSSVFFLLYMRLSSQPRGSPAFAFVRLGRRAIHSPFLSLQHPSPLFGSPICRSSVCLAVASDWPAGPQTWSHLPPSPATAAAAACCCLVSCFVSSSFRRVRSSTCLRKSAASVWAHERRAGEEGNG